MIFVFLFLLSFSLSLSSNPLCGNFLTFLQRGVQGAKVVNGTDLFFLWAQTVKNLLSMQETQVRSLGRENPLRREWLPTPVCCLENPMDRGAWQIAVPGVTENQTQLSN